MCVYACVCWRTHEKRTSLFVNAAILLLYLSIYCSNYVNVHPNKSYFILKSRLFFVLSHTLTTQAFHICVY